MMARNKKDSRTLNLFDSIGSDEPQQEALAPGAVVLYRYALSESATLVAALHDVIAWAPFRHMVTPGGFRMSIATTSCGRYGWVSDRQCGYRYSPHDPDSGLPWPAMPACFARFATMAADEAGFPGFLPDACLINRYEPGSRLSLHQDKDEQDFSQPIVSLSFGIPAVFLFGGWQRADKTVRVPLVHGDVVVWGGPARLRYHGILPVKDGYHASTGRCRINLTFRKAQCC